MLMRGALFEFSLILFGKANDYIPYFVYAFNQIGGTGIGGRINGGRGKFKLECVRAGDRIVYSRQDGKLREIPPCPGLELETLSGQQDAGTERIELKLVTPLRLKYQNGLKAELPFHVLVRALLRRISSLYEYHGEGEPPLDYRGLVDRAKHIDTEASSLRWFDWKRYSNRQEQAMLMGGLVGSITYRGNLGEFLPLIRFCEKAHLGKQTTFGLGKISIAATK